MTDSTVNTTPLLLVLLILAVIKGDEVVLMTTMLSPLGTTTIFEDGRYFDCENEIDSVLDEQTKTS